MAKLTPIAHAFAAPLSDFDAHDKEYDALQEASLALPNGEIVGGILRFRVADNYAYYRVTSAEPLTVEHLLFADCYQVQPARILALNTQDVVAMLNLDKAMFGRSGARPDAIPS